MHCLGFFVPRKRKVLGSHPAEANKFACLHVTRNYFPTWLVWEIGMNFQIRFEVIACFRRRNRNEFHFVKSFQFFAITLVTNSSEYLSWNDCELRNDSEKGILGRSKRRSGFTLLRALLEFRQKYFSLSDMDYCLSNLTDWFVTVKWYELLLRRSVVFDMFIDDAVFCQRKL